MLLAGAIAAGAQTVVLDGLPVIIPDEIIPGDVQAVVPGEAPPAIPDDLCNDPGNNPVELRGICPPHAVLDDGAAEGNSIDPGTTSGIPNTPRILASPPLALPNDPLNSGNQPAISAPLLGNPAISLPPIR